MTPTADLLILNARVLTLDPGRPKATEIAVIDGKIAAVGAQGELASLRGPGTEVIDAGGGSVVPGFSENHMHLFSGSAELVHLQLSGVHGLAALTEAIRNYGKDRREQVMLFAQGADYTILGGEERLTRHHLDAIWPDQPLALFAPDHHTAWANTKALELANLLHGAELRPGNEIVLGDDGLATGELREMEAFSPVQAAGGFARYRLGLATGGEPDPRPTDLEWRTDMEVMRRGLQYCARHGITTIQHGWQSLSAGAVGGDREGGRWAALPGRHPVSLQELHVARHAGEGLRHVEGL